MRKERPGGNCAQQIEIQGTASEGHYQIFIINGILIITHLRILSNGKNDFLFLSHLKNKQTFNLPTKYCSHINFPSLTTERKNPQFPGQRAKRKTSL